MSLQARSKSDTEISWVDPKRRTRPTPIKADKAAVGRDSGAASAFGTFGKSGRSQIACTCLCSPNADTYYQRNHHEKNPLLESSKEFTQGIGDRGKLDPFERSGASAGPGSYDGLVSAKGKRSALDGADYCNFTLRDNFPSNRIPKNITPGPHAVYQVRRDLACDRPTYKREPFSHGTRHRYAEDSDGPGPGSYDLSQHTIGKKISKQATGTKNGSSAPTSGDASKSGTVQKKHDNAVTRFGRTTFGGSERMPDRQIYSASPNDDLYYTHCNFLTSENYLADARSCRFGVGQKTDLSNPGKLSEDHRPQVSPAYYSPSHSVVRKTTMMDGGFAERSMSPICTGARAISSMRGISSKCMPRSFNDGDITSATAVSGSASDAPVS